MFLKVIRYFFYLDVLRAGSNISNWEALTSENGKFNAKLSIAGDLVVKMVQSAPEWRTNVQSDVEKGVERGPFSLKLDVKNELFVYNKDSEITWRSNTKIDHPLSKNGYLKMENNGKLTIYRGDGKPLWQSGTDEGNNKCPFRFKVPEFYLIIPDSILIMTFLLFMFRLQTSSCRCVNYQF